MKKVVVMVALVLGLAFAAGASAAGPFGGATANADGSVTLNSALGTAGLDIGLPGVTFVGDIAAFSLNSTMPLGCPNGTPSLAIITVRGTIWVSLGSVS